jgi:Transmembrane family, TMEM144 of transporters
LLWSCANLLWGWCIGVFGLFGTEKEVIAIPPLNYVGMCCGMASLFLFFFIKPSLDEVQAEAGEKPTVTGELRTSGPLSYRALGSESDEYMRTVLEEQRDDPDETTVILSVADDRHSFTSDHTGLLTTPSHSHSDNGKTSTSINGILSHGEDSESVRQRSQLFSSSSSANRRESLAVDDPEVTAIPVDSTESFLGILLTENKYVLRLCILYLLLPTLLLSSSLFLLHLQ